MSESNIPAPPLVAPSPGAAASAPPAPPLAPEKIESAVQNWEAAHEIHPAPPIPTAPQIETPSFRTNEWQDGVQFGVTLGFYAAFIGFIAFQTLVSNLREIRYAYGAEPHHAIMARYGKIALSAIVLVLTVFLIGFVKI